MKTTTFLARLAGASSFAALAAAHTAAAQDVDAGREVFRENCSLCHSAEAAEEGGAQGPALNHVFGRQAGADPDFGYTEAMANADLTWDAETLDAFLAAPTEVVPGTNMVIPVADATDREALIAYLEFVDETEAEPVGPAPAQTAGGAADWRNDAPGRVHRVDIENLPEPYATESAMNFPRVLEQPDGAELSLPDGFAVETFTTELQAPRTMLQAANGDIFVTETNPGRILVLRQSEDGAGVASQEVYAEGLQQPFGLAFYPSAENPEWLYVAEADKVVRYPYSPGDTQPSGEAEEIVPELPGGGHFTRDLVFAPDGEHFYVSVGSATNVGENVEPKTGAELEEWISTHAPGEFWGAEESRALVLEFAPDGSEREVFATGLRNCVGLTVQPGTGDLWCTVNERDQLGDNLVPDYSTRMNRGDFFGWPWYYMGDYEDPRLEGQRPDLAGTARVPDTPYTAHSASVDMLFYEPSDGASAFPADYDGAALAVLHGSWNRANRTGHKIVRVLMEDGEPTGAYEDFLTGFITDSGDPWGRPVAIEQLQDGSLLLADDGANIIYRITYGQ